MATSKSPLMLNYAKFEKTVSVPDGTSSLASLDVDISEYTDGKSPIGCIAKLGAFPLPFGLVGSGVTYVSSFNATTLTIANRNSAWNNYLLSVILFF